MVPSQSYKASVFVLFVFLAACSLSRLDNQVQKSDAIVLLAGSHSERVPAAAALFRNGYSKRVIVTNDGVGGGWSKKYDRSLTVSEWTEEELIALGVPRLCIITLPFYKSGTMYDALVVTQYARSNGFDKLILVTSDYHAKRALWCFRRLSENGHLKLSVSSVKSSNFNLLPFAFERIKFLYYIIRLNVLHLEPTLGKSAQ